MSTKVLFPCGGGSNLIFGYRYRKLNISSKNSSHYQVFHQILENCNFGVKEKSLPTQMDLYDPYIVPYTIPLGYYNFARSTNKLKFSMKFSHLEKNCQFNEIPKIWTPKHFSLVGGGSNLILGTGMENQIFILRTPATINFFHQILNKWHFCVKINHYPPRCICIAHTWSPTWFHGGIIIFQGVLTKFNFLMKFPHLEKKLSI